MSAYTHHGDCSIKDPCLRCKEFGATQERERIIALIEAKDEWHYAFSDVSDIIALIKGDNK